LSISEQADRLGKNTDSAENEIFHETGDNLLGQTERQGRYKVLVVDDEAVNLQVIRNNLSLEGCDVQTVYSGSEALENIKKNIPDIILLDVMMPKMNGYETAGRIRKEFSREQLPIIFLTAKNQVSDIIDGFDAGGNDYLFKPISKNELLTRMGFHMELTESRNELKDLNENLEKKVEERTIQLETALDELVRTQDKLVQNRKMAALGDLVAGVAHEINNPVGICLSSSSRIEALSIELNKMVRQKDVQKENVIERVERIIKYMQLNLKNMQKVAGRVSEFKKIADRDSFDMHTRFNLDRTLRNTLKELKPSLAAFKPKVLYKCPKDLEMEGAPEIMAQIISLFVDNTIVHAGLDAFGPGQGEILLSVSKAGDNFTIHYHDNGRGIDKKLVDRIFEPLVTTKPGGEKASSGMGLAIIHKHVVKSLKGSIQCESDANGGAAFTIFFKNPSNLQ